MTSSLRLGQALVAAGHIDVRQLEAALLHQRRSGGGLAETVIALGFAREDTVLAELAAQLGVAYLADLDRVEVPAPVLRLLPERLVRSRGLLPLGLADDTLQRTLVVASSDPGDLSALDEAAFAAGSPVRAVLVARQALGRAVERHLRRRPERPLAVVVELPRPTPVPRAPVTPRPDRTPVPLLPALAAGG